MAGVGTGGTITGVGEILKQELGDVLIVAVEPAESPVLSGGEPGPHEIQGIGAGFVPSVLNRKVIDEIVHVHFQDARRVTRNLARKEGIFAGISSGSNCWAALQIARRLGKGARVVTMVCDLGERYLSHPVYAE